MAVIKVDENDPVGELEPSFPFRDVKILHNVDVRDYYDLKEEIGRGKFGTVYRCVEKKTGTVLAAKFVGIAKKQDRINVEREVEIMRTLQHPRLIQLYDSFEIHNVMCVVLELIQGGELFERVIDDDFILTEKACSVFMRQICEGVSFIHDNKIIHLDLKPENILCLTKTGNRIKIIDFGLARKYDPDKKLQVLFGTPEFVAPEVVNFDEITSATDMWSVGVICYVLLSGLSPFMGESDLQTMTNVTMAQYDFDDEAFDTISADAKDFISNLLVKNKEKRMTAGDCLGHTWLRRKPPPPTTFLEESKENLKTYVDTIHTSSPFLLCDSLSNGSIDDVQLIGSPPEITKPKAGSPDKTVELFELAPEIPNVVNEQTKNIFEEQNLKLKNEINLEKSVLPNIIIQTEPSVVEEMPSNSVTPSTTVQFENKENVPRSKLIKTDSFKGLPRKFSITSAECSRELPRRSSLSRTDKGKIELKRENFVTFIGPREIKPIEPLSPDVKHAVEELTNFIKLNIEASTSKVETESKIMESSTFNNCKTVDNKEKEVTFKTKNIEEESYSPVRSKSDIKPVDIVTSIKSIANYKETKFSEKSTSLNNNMITNNLSLQKSQERVKKKDDIPAFLRPADYIKSIQMSRDSSLSSFKSLESKTLGSLSITGVLDKKPTADILPNTLSSFSKELPTLKPTSVSTLADGKESYSSIRNQSFVETIYKRQTGITGFSKATSFDSEANKAKLKATENVKTWHSTAIRNDLTLPRKFTHGIKTNESVNNPKESPSTSLSDANKARASSLDPTSAGYSTAGTIEQPFQSRFLRSSQINTARCSSETPVSKYEEFKNRYSNYKELASDNDKLFKKSFVERTPPGKKEKIVETSANKGRGDASENIPTSLISSKSSFISQSASTSSSFLARQKFKLTEQQRDSYNKFDSLNRLNKTESVASSFRSEKERSYSSASGIKESLAQKHSHTSTQNSESKSKLAVPEKCPTSPQKSV